MKYPVLYTSLCLLGVFVSYSVFNDDVSGVDDQKGKKDVSTEAVAPGERKVSDFNRVVLQGKGTLHLQQTGNESLKIEAEKDIEPEITAEVKYGVLTISHKGKGWLSRLFSSEKPITYHLQVKDLESVTIEGSGIIQGQDQIKSEKLKLEISGSGTMQLNVQVKDIQTLISGSGIISISGDTQEQSITIRGHGEYVAEDFSSKVAEVKILGAGDVVLNVSKNLDVSIAGSGNVTYLGQPKVNKHISGSGSVHSLQR